MLFGSSKMNLNLKKIKVLNIEWTKLVVLLKFGSEQGQEDFKIQQ